MMMFLINQNDAFDTIACQVSVVRKMGSIILQWKE